MFGCQCTPVISGVAHLSSPLQTRISVAVHVHQYGLYVPNQAGDFLRPGVSSPSMVVLEYGLLFLMSLFINRALSRSSMAMS